MTSWPRVSIVIPVYNGSEYLREAVDSALAQTYANVEVIVVNDGSTDDGRTDAVARSYGGKIRYFCKDNGGVSSALNVGIREMTGEYFSWLSHDDIYFPDKIEKQIDYIQNNPEVKLVTSNFVIIDKDGNTIRDYVNSTHPILRTGRDALSVWTYGCCILIHKDCFNKVGLWNENNRTTQDDEMWLRFIRYYPIYFMRDKLCKSRQHAEQGTVKLAKQHLKDKYNYFKWILQEFDIQWFFPADSEDSSRLRSETYTWIGDYAGRVGSLAGANLCYRYAVRSHPFSAVAWRKFIQTSRNIQRFVEPSARLFRKIGCLKSGGVNV